MNVELILVFFLNNIAATIDNEPFFCSLCAETKSRITKRPRCPECARFICKSCFESLSLVELAQCPYCSSPNIKKGTKTGTHETIEIIKKASQMVEVGDFLSAEAYFQ